MIHKKRLFQCALTLTMFIQVSNLFAQEKGIHFEQNLNWQQIQAKAKEEDKYIFVDCYATWCGPCKQMDKQVYADSLLGALVNENFISVKVQMDSTKNDNAQVRLWRNDARRLEKTANVNAYPSFLFYSPGGKLVYKMVGFQSVLAFMKITTDATESRMQTYNLLEEYRNGSLYDAMVIDIINKLNSTGDGQMAQQVAIPFIQEHLIKEPKQQLFTHRNIGLMTDNLTSSEDTVFGVFRQNSGKIDSIMNDRNFAFNKLFEIIGKEEFEPKLWFGRQPISKNPNWDELEKTIEIKYGRDFAARLIVYAKVAFYARAEQWKELVKSDIEQVEEYGQNIGIGAINDMVYSHFFLHSDDKKALSKAAGWMKPIIEKHPNNVVFLDTYANVLYKLGDKKEAIPLEQKAHNLAKREDDLKDTGDALAKMLAGKPSWPTK